MIKNEYDVIVIGAGISGIGASQILAQHKISHLILQSRNRLGGRILQTQLDGAKVELGATFVHSPNSGTHLIDKFIKENKKEVIPAQYHLGTYYYENQGILPDKPIQKGEDMYQKFQSYAKEVSTLYNDRSVQQVLQQFEKLFLVDQDQNIRNIVRWKAGIHGNIEGAELNELSLNQFVDVQCQTPDDYISAEGYWSIFKQILSKFQTQILLQQQVVQVDYKGQLIAVKTKKGDVFYCKQLISSLPLGVLQQEKVKFNPSLPKEYVEAIKDMGNGVANKMFVSFEKPFWKENQKWLNFVTKQKKNRYPLAVVWPRKLDKHIICVFISGQPSVEVSQWSDEEVKKDFAQFISSFVQEEVTIRDLKLSRWHLDEHSLGSYSYCKGGEKFRKNIDVLAAPLQNKVWFIGEHMNKSINGCVHSAYQTGVQIGEKVSLVLKQGE